MDMGHHSALCCTDTRQKVPTSQDWAVKLKTGDNSPEQANQTGQQFRHHDRPVWQSMRCCQLFSKRTALRSVKKYLRDIVRWQAYWCIWRKPSGEKDVGGRKHGDPCLT